MTRWTKYAGSSLRAVRSHANQNGKQILIAGHIVQRQVDFVAAVEAQIETQRGLHRIHRAGQILANFLGFEDRQIGTIELDLGPDTGQRHLGAEAGTTRTSKLRATGSELAARRVVRGRAHGHAP